MGYLCFTLLALMAILGTPAAATPFTSVIVYGDSLSDNGNLFALAGQPAAPYWNGRVSNGPVAVEYLAASLGVPLRDFAWAGATTGIGNELDGGTPTSMGSVNLPGMQTAFGASISSPAVQGQLSTALFVVWGGLNDFLSPSPLDHADPAAIAARSVTDLASIASSLRSMGAQHILVPGLPDVGLTPRFHAAAYSKLTDAFNSQLVAALPAGVTYFDTSALLRSIVANPVSYGLTNVTDACYSSGAVCASPDQYLFWDDLHPTTRAHAILGEAFAGTVPEPSTFIMVVSAAGVLAFARRLRIRA
ncbi:MAG TPA: SGNH/GDSL hydrolase family protein [Bryobacteraceae bacterium]